MSPIMNIAKTSAGWEEQDSQDRQFFVNSNNFLMSP